MGPLRPTKLMQEEIYIKTYKSGFIPDLHMQGPIVNPTPCTRETAFKLIKSGLEVFQIWRDENGKDHSKLLTIHNIYPGEGDKPEPPAPDHDKDGVQKPTVPTSGVAQKDPVKPVTFKGVAAKEGNAETTEKENTSAGQTNTKSSTKNSGKSNKNRNKNQNK